VAAIELDRVFGALADGTRRGAVDLLRKRPRRAGELARALDVSAPAMSRHLRVLRKAGLVEEDDAGDGGDDNRVRVYRLRKKPFAALRHWVEDVEAFWDDQLAAFKAHAERTTRGGGGRT